MHSSSSLVENNKDDSQEDAAHEVSECGEVGNGRVVRVNTPGPHPVNHHIGDMEQQAHLNKNNTDT